MTETARECLAAFKEGGAASAAPSPQPRSHCRPRYSHVPRLGHGLRAAPDPRVPGAGPVRAFHPAQGAKDAPIDFRFAVAGLGTHLREIADRLPGYQRRRDILRDWVLPGETWRELAASLPETPGERPVLDDRKRQIASIFIWTHVTAGEHLFAPRPLEQAQPGQIRRAWAARRPTTRH